MDESEIQLSMKSRHFWIIRIAVLLAIFISLLVMAWPTLVEYHGVATTGSVIKKSESTQIRIGEWFRRFQVVARFSEGASSEEHHTACFVDQTTYDALHDGDHIEVQYFPVLLEQTFIPASQLQPCTRLDQWGSNPVVFWRFGILLGSFVTIVFLVRIIRLQMGQWLFVPWFGLFVVYGLCPRAEPVPSLPRPGSAEVRSIYNIATLLSGSGDAGSSGLQLYPPYQLIELVYTPDKATEPVAVIDAIDRNSIPNLREHQVVDIDIDGSDPRLARIQGGTRYFAPQALHKLLVLYGVMVGLLAVGFLSLRAWRSARSN